MGFWKKMADELKEGFDIGKRIVQINNKMQKAGTTAVLTDEERQFYLANEKMQEINAAYDQIQKERASGAGQKDSYGSGGYGNYSYGNYGYGYSTGNGGTYNKEYAEIRHMINDNRFSDAEKRLSAVPEEVREKVATLMSLMLWKNHVAN